MPNNDEIEIENEINGLEDKLDAMRDEVDKAEEVQKRAADLKAAPGRIAELFEGRRELVGLWWDLHRKTEAHLNIWGWVLLVAIVLGAAGTSCFIHNADSAGTVLEDSSDNTEHAKNLAVLNAGSAKACVSWCMERNYVPVNTTETGCSCLSDSGSRLDMNWQFVMDEVHAGRDYSDMMKCTKKNIEREDRGY